MEAVKQEGAKPATCMQLAGYISLTDRGFAFPTYERADLIGNACYRAVPEIDGDHSSAIAEFEVLNGPNATPLDRRRNVSAGDHWLDIFLWDDRALVGTTREIYEALADQHVEIAVAAPLTFLDLGLAAEAVDTPRMSAAARTFLHRALGERTGERNFRDVVIQPGVALAVRRCLHRFGDPVPFGAGVGFDTVPINEQNFHIVLDGETLRRVSTGSLFEDVRAAIARFGRSLGLGIEMLEPPSAPAAVEPRDETPPPPEPDAVASVGGGGRKPRSRLFGLVQEMAMDLGTNNIRVHARGRGVVLSEPSVIAVERRNGIRKVFAVGDEAKRALDRTPENVEVIRPLRDGVIVDLDAAVMMLGGVIRRIRPVGLVRRPLDLVICIPCGSTSVERRSLQDAARKAGASNTWLVEAPLAAAIGAGLPVNQPVGSMIVQVGGGTTEIALVALSGLAYTTSVRVGGDMMDEAIVNYVRRSHNLLIGLRSAEQLKREIGSALRPADGIGALARVKGRDLVNGVPKEIEMNQGQIAEAIAEPVGTILEGVRIALENTAPELAGDIVEQGIVLTGGGALLQGLEDLLRNETGLWVRVADDPTQCVTIGLARILDEEIWRPLLK